MIERTVGLEIEKAHAELKTLLLQKGCRMEAEELPELISVKQGSLWGISPRTAKKTVTYRLVPVDNGTRITYSTALASDWKKLTIIGTALAVFVASICWWIASDLDAFMTTEQPTYWSWLAIVNGYVDFQTAQILNSLTAMLAVFLAITIVAEVAIAVYAHFRINAFAEETLNAVAREV